MPDCLKGQFSNTIFSVDLQSGYSILCTHIKMPMAALDTPSNPTCAHPTASLFSSNLHCGHSMSAGCATRRLLTALATSWPNTRDLKRGIPTIFPSARNYSRAAHWHHPHNEQPSLDRMTGLVGLAAWQGVSHPWLDKAIDVCLEHVASTRYDFAHTIQNAFCLLESVTSKKPVDILFNKLSNELLTASFYNADAPVTQYGLTPLEYAPSPEAYCRRIFSDAQIEAHLTDLEAHQGADGGWTILWDPPAGSARQEWRAQKTLLALTVLQAYGRHISN